MLSHIDTNRGEIRNTHLIKGVNNNNNGELEEPVGLIVG